MERLKSYRIGDSIQSKYPGHKEQVKFIHELFDKCKDLSLLKKLDKVTLPAPVMTYFYLINIRQYYLLRSLIVEINDENAYGAFKALRGLIETVAVLVGKYKEGKEKFKRDPQNVWQFFKESVLEARNFPSQKFIVNLCQEGKTVVPVASKNRKSVV